MNVIDIHDAETPLAAVPLWALSQAQIEGMTLLTRDAAVLRCGALAMAI